MGKRPENLIKVVELISDIFIDKQYAIRGTTSLVLQDLDMNVDDIDIICNEKTANECNQLLSEYLVDPVSLKENEKFRSYFGKFEIWRVPVEIMGEWQIKNKRGEWSDCFDGSKNQVKEIEVNKKKVWVTTVETELNMFTLMGRWKAYQKIKRQVDELTNDTKQCSLPLF